MTDPHYTGTNGKDQDSVKKKPSVLDDGGNEYGKRI